MSDATDDMDYANSGQQAKFRKADKELWEKQKQAMTDPNQNIEQLRKEIRKCFYDNHMGDEVDDGGIELFDIAATNDRLVQLITSKVNQARYDELEKLLTVGEENITLNDIYGDDRRNNYGYQETQVRDASNHLKRRFTKVIQDRLSTLKEDMK